MKKLIALYVLGLTSLVLAGAGLVPWAVAAVLMALIGLTPLRALIESLRNQEALRSDLRAAADHRALQASELTILRAQVAEAQAAVAEARKAATVGRLAAGVAHQATQPLLGVLEGREMLDDAWQRARTLIGVLRTMVLDADPRSGEARIDEVDRRVNFRSLLQDFPRALTAVRENVARTSAAMRALQDTASPGDGKPVDLDVASCVDTAVELTRDRWSRVADLQVTHSAGLPMLPAIRDELNAALVELICNAADAIRAKDPAARTVIGRIDVYTTAIEGGVEILVTDDGVGIHPERQARILSAPSGGIAAIRTCILRKHHGELTLRSQPGVGTTFRVVLPAAATHLVQVDLARAAK